MSENQALLVCNEIPNDIVINKIYPFLCSIKKPLSEELIEAIEELHFHFLRIIRKYYLTFSKDDRSLDYFMDNLENALYITLNDNELYFNGLSENLQNEHPQLTVEYLLRMDAEYNQPNRIYKLWKMLTYEKKKVIQRNI